MSGKRIVGLTMGDPAGVGPEVCLRAMAHPAVLDLCTPIVFADAGVLREVALRCHLPVPKRVMPPAELGRERSIACPAICDLGLFENQSVQPGEVRSQCGTAAFRCIEAAIYAALGGHICTVVTAPINKEALRLAGIQYPGHTEIFTALTGAKRSCMLLAAENIACSFVTTHLAYADAAPRITTQRVLDVIELTADAVTRLRGHSARLVVCGLNPHAGEHGLFGNEEALVIVPAVARAREKSICVEGPVSPDAAFLPSLRARTDAYVCMYHDQGHIPFKMLAFERGVNITLGLPIIRTSVDHGTAFDIAWQGRASAESMIQAIRYAVQLAEDAR